MRTISTFIVAMLVVSLVVGVFSLFYASVADNYSKTYNTSNTEGYEQFSALEAQASEINTTVNQIQSDSGVFDVVGGLLKSGYTVLKTTQSSVGIFNDMSNQAFEDSNLGPATYIFRNHLLLIVLILFIFTIVGVLVGRTI